MKPCTKCGSTERNSNGDCRPCQIACSAAWKVKDKARIAASGEPLFYTYIHRRADDGKVFYVGKGTGARASADKNRNKHWHRIVKKHGILVEIVERFASEEKAFESEKLLIASFRQANHPLCNYTDGGDGTSGWKHTDETRAKLSAMQIGKVIGAEQRAKISAAGKGRIVSKETREKISAKNKGKKCTPEQIEKNRAARIGKPLSAKACANISAAKMGHSVSPETRAKISAGHIGMKNSAEARAKISAGNKGKVRTEEFKKKIVAALTGRPCSEETRKKISEGNKGRIVSQEMRERIAKKLTGRKLSEEEKARLYSLQHSPEIIAKRVAKMRGKKWSAAHRAAHNKEVPKC